jgi:NAD(P)H-nitrite reductase large subunit
VTAAEAAQLEARGVRVVRGEIAQLVVEDDRLTGVELADGRRVARTAVFIRPNNGPHDDGLAAGLGCAVDEAGFVVVDATGAHSSTARSSVPSRGSRSRSSLRTPGPRPMSRRS